MYVCAVPQRPHELKLPSELLYASCACADRAQLADVRSRFKMATQGHVRREPACESRPPNCLVEEVVVDCRRRSMASIGNVELVCPTSRKDVLVLKRPSPTQFNIHVGQGHFHHQSETGSHGHSTRDHRHGSHNVTILHVDAELQETLEDRRTDQGSSDNRAILKKRRHRQYSALSCDLTWEASRAVLITEQR